MNGRRSTETPHYLLLDGLRGIAALMVLGYHLLEAVAFAAGNPEQKMFHGFLAVDFFLILSGFVMGHAYDQRWSKGMSVKTFFRRRLKRLHPMVIMGVMLGLVIFCLQGCQRWDGTVMPWPVIAVGTLLSLLLLPVPSAIELRGNTELFPLNGPHWSLFFEYVFNILYALLLRHLNTKVLSVWVAMAAIALFGYASLRPEGCIAFGWSSEGTNLLGGLLRVGFDYPAGLLLARLFRQQTVKQNPTTTQNTFLWLSIALCVLLCIPSLGMMNPAYELCCVAIAFPAIVWIGAKSTCVSKRATTYRLLGDLSYPLYAIHYPLIYLYIGWINNDTNPLGPTWATPILIAVLSIIIAYLCMQWYDRPVRQWLSRQNQR